MKSRIVLFLVLLLSSQAGCAQRTRSVVSHPVVESTVMNSVQRLTQTHDIYRGCLTSAEDLFKPIVGSDGIFFANAKALPTVFVFGFGGNYIISNYFEIGKLGAKKYLYSGKLNKVFYIGDDAYDRLLNVVAHEHSSGFTLRGGMPISENIECTIVVNVGEPAFKVYTAVSDDYGMDYELVHKLGYLIDRILYQK